MLQELQLLAQNEHGNREKNQRLTYVTATYFLLVKRKELV
jgi:hypothetical protein